VLNPDSIPKLGATIVAGGANNQLLRDEDGQALFERGILYAPDYVINAGGIINVCGEHLSGWTEADVNQRVDNIGQTLTTVFDQSAADGLPTNVVADRMARARIGHDE
jgi:leucine dehydrogenase